MLPSFRLIAATFLCGFVVVFAGLRMAASLNDMHEGLPVLAAHAAPVPAVPAADSEARRGLAAVPVMYDLRFAVSAVSPTMVRAAPTVFDRPAPALSIVPLQDLGGQDLAKQDLAEPAKETPEPPSAVAAIEPDAPVSATTDAPVSATTNSPASLDAPAEPPNPNAPAVATVEPKATPDLEASAPEALLTEPNTTASVPVPGQGVDPAPAAVSVPAAKAAKPAPKAAAKIARKKRVRTAQRAAPASNSLGVNPAANPFSTQRQ
jgi:hypothetical protein